ncbi:nucleotide-diphospho-sugar transferase [Cristinia sonorae]|uniref:Nucleotide-diphospho-sugar transferase n=1 Tax=Cristinia sonorae TaxID=1940300 RepID=A0A8K0UW09_9AGAR|nr:nucleotide-diphospho-sugar transferase [Cristinia sonorae]
MDERYGVAIGSAEYWRQGKFVDHGLDLIPTFDAHYSVSKEIPTDTLGYNAVVLYLISDIRLRETILSLSLLHKNVPMQPWPIVLFHTDDMKSPIARRSFMMRIYDALGRDEKAKKFMQRIEFVHLENWALPPDFPTDKDVVNPSFDYAWPDYHIMCGFYAYQIFDHPRLQNVTYYMRLDTDSYIYKPLCYDPIDIVHTRNKIYGYRSLMWDPPFVIEGLWDFTDQYARDHPEVENMLKKNGLQWPNGRIHGAMGEADYPTYYNNLEVVKLEAFRQPAVKQLLKEIMKDPNRIYNYRWGDAPIRFMTVNMFFDVKRDVEEYCGMKYWHSGNWHGNKCRCEDELAGRT